MTQSVQGTGLPAWVEVAADDTAAAAKFYSDLFGWTSESIGDENFEYHILHNGDKTIGGLAGKMNEYQPTQWLTYLRTPDIEKAIKDVAANGGKTYIPASPMPGGQFTVASDPAGSPFGIVQLEGEDPAASFGEENGLIWYELELKDKLEETIAFYTAVFGWTATKQIENDDMTYYTQGEVVGVFTTPDFPDYLKGQSQWAVTFRVADVDAFAEKAKGLGATVEHVMKDTPYGDFAMIRDPQGAFFTVMKPAATMPA